MTFRNADGEDIEYDGRFSFTKQSISPLNGSIKGDVSINFSIDNNSYNRKVLGYYGPQMLNQIAFSRLPFTRLKNNVVLDSGYIVIQSEDDKLDCFYLSGNANWIQSLQYYISEMDLSDYRTAWNITNIQASPTSGIIFCLADWVANGQKGGDRYSLLAPFEVENDDHTLTQPQILPDFYPCFYLHSLVTEIMERSGLKLSGSILDDPLYKSKAIGPESPLMTRDVTLSKIVLGGAAQTVGSTGVEEQYINFTETSDPDGLFASNTYTANKYTSIIFQWTNRAVSAMGTLSTTNYFMIKKNGSPVFYFNNGTSSIPVETTHSIPCAPGDRFTFFYNVNSAGSRAFAINIYESAQIWPRDWVEPQFFLPKIKAIEIVKYLINFFCCSVSFDQFSRTISMNVIDKIKKEDAEDWSDKYLGHGVDYSDINKNNFIEWAGSGLSDYVTSYNRRTNLDFAHGNIETDKDTKEDGTIVKFPFVPTVVRENTNGAILLNAPLAKLTTNESLTFTSFNATNATVTAVVGSIDAAEVQYGSHQYIRVYNVNRNDGVFIASDINRLSGNLLIRFYDSTGYTSGRINTFTIEYIKGLRIFTVKIATTPSEINAGTSMRVVWETPSNAAANDCTQKVGTFISNYTDITTLNWISFTKPQTGYPIDAFKNNLAIDNPDILDTYKDPTVKERYYKYLTNMVTGPRVTANMLLSEIDFLNFNFDKFIYLRTETLQGYFFVTKIESFVNSNTPVKVTLLKV